MHELYDYYYVAFAIRNESRSPKLQIRKEVVISLKRCGTETWYVPTDR